MQIHRESARDNSSVIIMPSALCRFPRPTTVFQRNRRRTRAKSLRSQALLYVPNQ